MGIVTKISTDVEIFSVLRAVSLLQLLSFGVALFISHRFLYAFLLSPVRHIPGPYLSRLSRLPLLWATFKRRRTEFASKLIDEYGPIVVIAPDQVHTINENAMKIIYDKTSIKTSFYSSMGCWKGVTSTLGFIDYASAAPTRNNLIQCFQNKNLATLAENMGMHVQQFIDLLREKAKANEKVDGIVVFRLVALDIVTDVLWGERQTLLGHGIPQTTPILLRRFHAFSSWNALKSFLPGADTIVSLFGSKAWRQLRSDCEDMDILAKDALHRWNEMGDYRRDRDVLSMLKAMDSLEDPKKRLPNDHIPAYMVEMLAAGSSTTSHTAAFACWLLTRNADVQKRLRNELMAAFPDAGTMDLKKTIDLPVLDSVIRETMRMYPMIPGPLERYISKEIVVDGKTLVPGVIASSSAYTSGRLEEVYPEPDKWLPGRWDDADERMKLNWIPFGYGSRACPGSNLALTELKYMIGAIFRKFEAVLPPGHENDTLELSDVFAAASRSGHCWLKFVELKKI